MAEDDLEFITPPNLLKSKVSVGGIGAVDEAAIKRAEEAIAGMTDEYLEWVEQDISQIDAACRELRKGVPDRAKKLQEIFQVAHDIKGQGGSFGFDLMTTIGNQVCRLIEKSSPDDPDLSEVISVHVDAMKLIISTKLKGDGGHDGKIIMAGLDKVVKKILK